MSYVFTCQGRASHGKPLLEKILIPVLKLSTCPGGSPSQCLIQDSAYETGRECGDRRRGPTGDHAFSIDLLFLFPIAEGMVVQIQKFCRLAFVSAGHTESLFYIVSFKIFLGRIQVHSPGL